MCSITHEFIPAMRKFGTVILSVITALSFSVAVGMASDPLRLLPDQASYGAAGVVAFILIWIWRWQTS